MKRNYFMIVCFTLGISLIYPVTISKNARTNDLNGNIKEIIISKYVIKIFNNETNKSLCDQMKYVYDKDGKLLEETCSYSDKYELYNAKYYYNKDGNEVGTASYNKNNEISLRYSNVYNENGLQTESMQFSGDSKNYRIKFLYKYDTSGNIVEKVRFSGDGELYEKYLYQYNNRNKMINYKVYDTNRNILSKYIYEYDNNGKQLKYESFDKILIERQTFQYDKNGNQIQEIWTNQDGSGKNISFYDKNNKLLEYKQYYSDGSLFRIYKHNYDDKSKETYTIIYDNNGKLFERRIYSYDIKYNVIKTEYYKINDDTKKEELFFTDEKSIEYY